MARCFPRIRRDGSRFYGCGCGEFGCANVAGLVIARGEQVEWTDFRSLTGIYHSALPEPESGPDPVSGMRRIRPRRLELRTLTFETQRYVAVVHEAMSDRSWETRPWVLIR